MPSAQGLDDAAANAFAGVSCRLAGEVIPSPMNDQRSAGDRLRSEAFRIECGPGMAPIAEQRRQVARVGGMRAVVRIEVPARACKGHVFCPGAVPSGVDMHGKDVLRASGGLKGKPPELCQQQGSVPAGVEIGVAVQRRMLCIPGDIGAGSRTREENGSDGVIVQVHRITSLQGTVFLNCRDCMKHRNDGGRKRRGAIRADDASS